MLFADRKLKSLSFTYAWKMLLNEIFIWSSKQRRAMVNTVVKMVVKMTVRVQNASTSRKLHTVRSCSSSSSAVDRISGKCAVTRVRTQDSDCKIYRWS